MREKLMATANNLAKVCGMKPDEMKMFIKLMKDIDSEDRTFNAEDGRRVDYTVYEAVKVIVAAESYKNTFKERLAEDAKSAEADADERIAAIYGGGLESGEYMVVP